MRFVLAALLLAGCSHPASGPKWPKPSAVADEDDGGESLAPHVARSVAGSTSIDVDDDDDVKPAAATTPAEKPAEKPSTPTPLPDDPFFDDFTIEIED